MAAAPQSPASREAASATYVGRRSRAGSAALSVADLRERMAIEALRQVDPSAAPLIAGALAAASLGGVSITTNGPDSDSGPGSRSRRHSAPAGRRRASRSSGPSIFSVPAGTATPGSRVAVARRRATAASRRRPLLLSTPIVIAAIIVGSSTGGERPTSANADTTAISQSSNGSTSLAQSDVRVSRQKREATATAEAATQTATQTAPSPADTTAAAASPLGGSAVPAPLTEPDPVAAVAEGGAPAAAPTAAVEVAPPPPAATWVRPVEGGNVTSCFCMRWGTFHDGIDIDPPLGTPIASVGDGTVMFAGPVSGYGIGIYIQHLDGTVSFYGHMAVYYVRTGDVVTTGQEIALVGNEGYSTGPHLHFSVFSSWSPNGLRQNAIDPIPWLADRGVTLGAYNPNG